MEKIDHGSVISPGGFRVGHAACGIKSEGPDVALITSDTPSAAAGVFTRNRFAAAPVQWSRSHLPASDVCAVVINAGNANACTGNQGKRDVRQTADITAELMGCNAEQIVIASTGIIGHPLPMNKLESGIRSAHATLSDEQQAPRDAERAIMTTDTAPKACAVEFDAPHTTCRIGGMAKGSGMIHPNMATMLGFITTDADISPDLLQQCLRRANAVSFNRISVDGDTSTNDSVIALANGDSGDRLTSGSDELAAFQEALQWVMQHLARSIARDGEGATKLVEINVEGARTEDDADRVARAIANSPLVKCAINGEDSNWGRIVCAAGYSGADFCPDKVQLDLGSTRIFADGLPTGNDASGELSGEDVKITLDLKAGSATATMWTCDLSKEYVEINAEYHT